MKKLKILFSTISGMISNMSFIGICMSIVNQVIALICYQVGIMGYESCDKRIFFFYLVALPLTLISALFALPNVRKSMLIAATGGLSIWIAGSWDNNLFGGLENPVLVMIGLLWGITLSKDSASWKK